jgi:SAM-dependent methyltransferase
MPDLPDPDHWNRVYTARNEAALTWFEDRPDVSMGLIQRHLPSGGAVIDVGGGASRLVDGLLAAGYGPLAVLDLSDAALAIARQRLGTRAAGVDWIAADVTVWEPARHWALWHDRAVFHFLTDDTGRTGYLRALAGALAPGGTAIMATFAEDGPETCSNLLVARYSPEALAATLDRLAPGLLLPVEALRHVHVTPRGNRQAFQISVFRRG